MPHLRRFLGALLAGRMPNLDPFPYNGRIPTGEKLRRTVQTLLTGARASDAVIALTDVYTGQQDFTDAADAKRKMRDWVGPDNRFHAHVAHHDFEVWLLPFWARIQKLARHNKSAPPGRPEDVNHSRPPSYRIKEIFRLGECSRHYSKVRDGNAILRDQDLGVAAAQCPELRSLLNTVLLLCGGDPF